jgi:hypothetical protein
VDFVRSGRHLQRPRCHLLLVARTSLAVFKFGPPQTPISGWSPSRASHIALIAFRVGKNGGNPGEIPVDLLWLQTPSESNCQM